MSARLKSEAIYFEIYIISTSPNMAAREIRICFKIVLISLREILRLMPNKYAGIPVPAKSLGSGSAQPLNRGEGILQKT